MKTHVIEGAQDLLNEAARSLSSCKLVPAGTVLVVTRSGILQHSLPVAVTAIEVAINQDLKALIPHAGISGRFVALQLRAEADHILEAYVKSGTTVESIDFARLRNHPIKIAPSGEQSRIVAKLEPLLARCALVRSELERIRKLVVRQRRETLAAAFRGSLNSAPRDAKGQLQDWQTVALSSLIVGRPSNGISPPTTSGKKGTLSLRLTATTSGDFRLDSNAIKRVQIKLPPKSKYWLEPGDLLVQRANSLEHVGASAIFDGKEQTYIYPDLMMKVRIEDESIRRYVWRYLNSPGARRYFQEQATGTAGNMPKITGRVLADLQIPLAPRDQINKILDLIDKLYDRLDSVVAECHRCVRLVNKLEKALLRKAFDGQLTKRDSSDEPADVLLKRIHQETNSVDRESRMGTSSRKHKQETVRTFMARQLKVWPSNGMTFEQLRAEAPGNYDELKDLVFELMETNRIGQRYDSRERKMKLLRLA
jgi:type I restriction enzyme, S subunit